MSFYFPSPHFSPSLLPTLPPSLFPFPFPSLPLSPAGPQTVRASFQLSISLETGTSLPLSLVLAQHIILVLTHSLLKTHHQEGKLIVYSFSNVTSNFTGSVIVYVNILDKQIYIYTVVFSVHYTPLLVLLFMRGLFDQE